MKFLTVFSVIFIPLTFIAGIYRTNFEVLPELQYQYGYFIMWGGGGYDCSGYRDVDLL
jgi:magnesium transporter